MKSICAFFIFIHLSFAGCALTGGEVPVINKVSAIDNVSMDLSQITEAMTLAEITIDNNTKGFILKVDFKNNGNFINRENGHVIFVKDLRIVEMGTGILGQGITPILNQELLPLYGMFIWKVEEQKTATCGYGLRIMGTWDTKDAMAGLYEQTIVTSIEAIE